MMVNLMTVNPMMAKASALCHVRSLVSRQAIALAIVFFFTLRSRAEGPKYVAGTSYFSSTVTGQPLTWERGQITYYTDPGELSPVLDNADVHPRRERLRCMDRRPHIHRRIFRSAGDPGCGDGGNHSGARGRFAGVSSRPELRRARTISLVCPLGGVGAASLKSL